MELTMEAIEDARQCARMKCPECSMRRQSANCTSAIATALIDSRELIDKQEALIKEIRLFCKDVADNYDCDSDGHKYNTGCRSCNAKAVLEKTKEYAD